MTRIEIRWPDEMAEQVRAARGRLEVAGEALREMSLEGRLQAVGRVLGDWTADASPCRDELAAAYGAASPFSEGTVTEGLHAALRAWNPDRFIEAARHELAPVFDSDSLVLAPYDWTAVMAGGSIPMPTLISALIPLVLGSPVLLRETSIDRVTAPLLARSLAKHSEVLARAFAHLGFPVDDTAALEALLEAPCVVATGSDETIRRVASQLRPTQRFVAYGHRFSIAVLGPSVSENEAQMRSTAEGLALDIARWDQTGCLSPVVVYLVDLPASAQLQMAGAISDALGALSNGMPRGMLSSEERASHATERAEARMRQAGGRATCFEGPDYTVVLEADDQPRPAPLQRFLRLMPVPQLDALERTLEPFLGHLSTVALAGLSDPDQQRLKSRLPRLGVSRFTRPGRMQTPPVDWPHDGMPLFSGQARFVQSERV
jgi:hypothetical protein